MKRRDILRGVGMAAAAAGLAACGKAGQGEGATVADEGPHLSYTFQWYLFALLGFIGFGWALRHEHRALRAAETGEPIAPARRRRGAGPTDDEIEDALLDAGDGTPAGRQASEISSA